MNFGFSFSLGAVPLRRRRRLGPPVDPNLIVFDNEASLSRVSIISAPDTLTLAEADGRKFAVLATNISGNGTRAYMIWDGKTEDGTYRYLVAQEGTQPSSSTRRGPLPFVRAEFNLTAAGISKGYHTDGQIVSGATNRFNLIRRDPGVDVPLITEDFNRVGTWGEWRWAEIKVEGSVISHRNYPELTAEGSIPAWQSVTDTTYASGLVGLGHMQGSGITNKLRIQEARFIPSGAVPPTPLSNIIANNKATFAGTPPASNTIISNKAKWT